MLPENLRVPEPPGIFLPNNVALTILLTGHAGETNIADKQDLIRKIRSADIFIPEIPRWTPEILLGLRRISEGNAYVLKNMRVNWAMMPPVKRKAQEFNMFLFGNLLGSNTGIIIADMPKGQLSNQIDEAYKFTNDYLRSTFKGTLAMLDKGIRKLASLVKQREDHILLNIGPVLQEYIDKNDELKINPKVNVFMILGLEHVGIYRRLKEAVGENPATPSVVVEFGLNSEFEMTSSKLLNAHKYDQELSWEEKERLLAEHLAERTIRRVFSHQFDSIIIHRLVRDLSISEIKQIFTSTDRKTNKINTRGKIWDKIRQQIEDSKS